MDSGGFYYETLANGYQVGRFKALDAIAGISHAVTTKVGPDVKLVRHEHEKCAALLGEMLGAKSMTYCNQVHGNTVFDAASPGLAGDADGLVTAKRGAGIYTRSADCVLILAADPVTGAVASVHASWRGTVKKIAACMVEKLKRDFSAKPENIVACIAPSAGPCCYEIGSDVSEEASKVFGMATSKYIVPLIRNGKDSLAFDLWRANEDQLLASGLASKNIHVAGVCTICNNHIFPSHRCEGDKAGRFAAAIVRSHKS